MFNRLGFIILFTITSLISNAQEGVKVSHNIPAVVKQGSEFTADVVLDKKGIEGFAKLQFTLPIGLSASNVESNGATFSFKDQVVNLVWMSLPELESFKVSFKINVSSTVFGEDTLGGNFSYMHNNEKQTYRIPTFSIDIQLPGDNGTAVKKTISAAPAVNSTPVTETASKNTESSSAPIAEAQPSSIEKSKESVNAPLESNAPSTVKNEAVAAVNAEKPTVAPVSSETVNKAVEKPTEIVSKPIEAGSKPVEASKAITETAKPEKASPKTTGIPAQAGVIFKVQIAALGSTPKPNAFSALTEISTYKSAEGLNKYYSGKFNTYDDAAKHLLLAKEKGFDQAFIAAFKNGAPIPIKEALGK